MRGGAPPPHRPAEATPRYAGWVLARYWVGLSEVLGGSLRGLWKLRKCKKMQKKCKKMQIYLHISKKSSTFVAGNAIVLSVTNKRN